MRGSDGGRVVITGGSVHTCWEAGLEAFWLRLGAEGLDWSRAQPSAFGSSAPPDGGRTRGDSGLAECLVAALETDLGEFLGSLEPSGQERAGVVLGSAYGHLGPYLRYFEKGTREGYDLVNPRWFPSTLPNFCSVAVNNEYSLLGSSTTLSTGVAAGLDAIGYGASRIRQGGETLSLCGGVDESSPHARQVLARLGLLSPTGTPMPFSQGRDGTVASDGIGVLLLQSEEGARSSGRLALAEVAGWASGGSCPWDDPGSVGRAARLVRGALREAGLEEDGPGAIFPSASGTIPGDRFERMLLDEILGSRLPSIPVHPVGEITGECFAASGPLRCLAAAGTLAGLQPGRPGYLIPADGSLERRPAVPSSPASALVYCAGFDGTFAAVALRRMES